MDLEINNAKNEVKFDFTAYLSNDNKTLQNQNEHILSDKNMLEKDCYQQG